MTEDFPPEVVSYRGETERFWSAPHYLLDRTWWRYQWRRVTGNAR